MKRKAIICLCKFLVVLMIAGPASAAERFIELDRKAMEQIQAAQTRVKESRKDMVKSTSPRKDAYEKATKECLAGAEAGSVQYAACSGAVDAFVEFVNVQVDYVEKYDGDLSKLQGVFDNARANAKTVEGPVPGSTQQIKVFNEAVVEMQKWDEVLGSVGTNESNAIRKDIRNLYDSFGQEIRISRANKNRLTDRFLDVYSDIILTNRHKIASYLRKVKSILEGTLKAQQSGEVNKTVSFMEDFFRDFDTDFVPEYLGRMGDVLDIVSTGGDTQQGSKRSSDGELEDWDEFLIKDYE